MQGNVAVMEPTERAGVIEVKGIYARQVTDQDKILPELQLWEYFALSQKLEFFS